ncbi:hypothetical protein CHS0354_027000, partial [Potamilus streckersoni]
MPAIWKYFQNLSQEAAKIRKDLRPMAATPTQHKKNENKKKNPKKTEPRPPKTKIGTTKENKTATFTVKAKTFRQPTAPLMLYGSKKTDDAFIKSLGITASFGLRYDNIPRGHSHGILRLIDRGVF